MKVETVNGEWIMLCCSPDDPNALNTLQDCRYLIHEIGFLPLFSNSISGFSVEEHVPPYRWWTGDPATDPWMWRMFLAEDESIAYGKFFNKCAGFISKEFFPVFANYRRNGYDFDALFDDELASYRSKKIMDVFELDDSSVGREIMSYDLKQLAGFGKREDGKAGEKGFEGVISELQMQTYLIMSRFAQKKNKKGEYYGWHIAALETPETKWGRDTVTAAYEEDPKESWKKITDQLRKHFPKANESEIQKLLGIRYPGESAASQKPKAVKKPKVRPPKDWIIPANPKYYDVEAAFQVSDEIDWKQGAGILPGDTVYIYMGAPVSAILYQCSVMETGIPYSYDDGNVRMKALMRIKLLKRYPHNQFTFAVLGRDYGIHAVRGPRGIPDSLSQALNAIRGTVL